jgi:hypothetical protein
MSKKEAVLQLVQLGKALREVAGQQDYSVSPDVQFRLAENMMHSTHINPWFTEDNIRFAFRAWSDLLQEENILSWLEKYPEPASVRKKIGLITAGNIPLVGLHDIICVLAAGHTALVKPSSEDPLLPVMIDLLEVISGNEARFVIRKEMLKDADAYIATGSNNSARYFDYYFGKYPHIIRKNRNSVAILTGEESLEELRGLADDILCYFGLGCRSVSKIYIPEKYDFQPLFGALKDYGEIIQHNRYANNYDYHRTIYLMNKIPLWENGFLLLKEDENIASPVSVLFYSYYEDEKKLRSELGQNSDALQCLVSKKDIPFGKTQYPALEDYADDIDTMVFLTQLPE